MAEIWTVVSEFGCWVYAALKEWWLLVTGGAITAALIGIQVWRGRPFSEQHNKFIYFGVFVMLAFFNAWRKLRVELSNTSKELEQAKRQVEESAPQIMLEARSVTSNDPKKITVSNSGKTAAYNIKVGEISNKGFTAVFDEIPHIDTGGYRETKASIGATGSGVFNPDLTLDWLLRQGWDDVSIVSRDFPVTVTYEDAHAIRHTNFVLRYTFHPHKMEFFRKMGRT